MTELRPVHHLLAAGFEMSLADKVSEGIRRETHMSWVFPAGDRVYKLKKPVRFPYLDFSTVERREHACRADLRLNRRLEPDVYLGVAPLTVEGIVWRSMEPEK